MRSTRLLSLACAIVALVRRARVGADHAPCGHALGSQDRRSDLDHRLHRAQPRLHGLRHAVRDGRQGRHPPADGGQVRAEPGQAHLHDDPAGRSPLARRQAGDGGGLRGLHQAVGGQGLPRPEDVLVREGVAGRQPEDLQDRAEGADRPRPPGARQAQLERPLHDAEAGGRDRSQHADLGLHRLRALRVPEGRVEAGRQGRLREVRAVQAAARAAVGARGRQGRQGGPRRVARHPRSSDRHQRAPGQRDRLRGVAAARPLLRSSRRTPTSGS